VNDPLPRTASDELLARFRRKIAANAAAWLDFVQVHGHDSAALDRELANLSKAAQQALAEPVAWDEGLALVGETWAHIELRGLWQDWRALLADGLRVSQEIGRPNHQARLLDQMGEVARLLGDNQRAQEHFEAATTLHRNLADPAGAGRSLAYLSQVQLARNDWDAAGQSCQQAVAMLTGLDRPNELALAHNNWGIVCQEQGRLEEALTHFEQAEAGFHAGGALRGQAKVVLNRGDTYRRQGQWDAAEAAFRRALPLYEACGDRLGMAILQMNLSIVLYQRGQPAEALGLSLEAETALRRLHNRPILARVCNNHGIFLTALGRLADASAAFAEAMRLHLENGDRLYAASALINYAEVLIDQRYWPEARERLAQARGLLDTLTEHPRWVCDDFEVQQARLEAATATQPAT
jgi:tetratricopeptide (TPR) repeat protein